MKRGETFEEQPAEQAREHAHGQEEAWLAGDPARPVRRQAAAGNDDVDMGMMGQRRSPGVQHGGEADAGAEMFGIGGDGRQRLGRRLEQQVVDGGLVLERDRRDRGRHGEDDVEIGNRQQLGVAVLQPSSGGGGLTLGTMAVAAGVVGDARVRAVLAALDMTAERGGATGFDRRHHLQLGEADMAGVGLAPVRAMGVENVGDLKTRPRHGARVRRAASARPGAPPGFPAGW